MRIIAGRFKGRRLVSFKEDHIRPTTDRVKESIFNKLNPWLEGARCLDLFAGTGNLSFEALSRGAQHVVAVELSQRSLRVLKENIKLLDIEPSEVSVVRDDVFKFLNKYEGKPFELIFVDPPFTEKWADQVMTALGTSAVLGLGTQVVIESGTKEPIGDLYGRLKLSDRRPYGDKTVSYFVCEEEAV